MEFQTSTLRVSIATRISLDSGRQPFFADKNFKTSPTLQGVQGYTLPSSCRSGMRERVETATLFRLRQGDHRAVQTDAGRPVFCRMLPAAEFVGATGRRRRLHRVAFDRVGAVLIGTRGAFFVPFR